jgi:hypothetical protein
MTLGPPDAREMGITGTRADFSGGLAIPTPELPTMLNQGQGQGQGARRILKSFKNCFGLFRQYYATDFPSHDPEELITQSDLSDVSCNHASTSFGPYPNQSSFLLGEWYWCGGVQKSKSSFKELVGIISNPEFSPADISKTKWDLIDEGLGGGSDDNSWIDEPQADASWMPTPVTISVPFHRNTPHPGNREFVIPDFYHRSVVTILRERLASSDARHFHFEPFELHWQPESQPNSVRVHGELYTSPAFLAAHEELQSSPPEPGCSLQRVVVGLMFASDATHMTTFGAASLWPLYMHFGNDSKYRRSKPSLHLCNHVAYFQKVSIPKVLSLGPYSLSGS